MQNELLQQQMDNLRRKRAALDFEHGAVEANKPMQQQPVMDYIPLFEDQPAGTLLQLGAPVHPHFHSYLHLSQPNFQDSHEP
ncbi:hypothetical protein Lalb_Chr08g0233811 [Lupinus albus]|uniref:Uncharacterized protein n=1 Tax=Lupinus albus TaxID=3870 RepID=A0A6A4Q3L6_LUPAL|nr:hypothetical protein Lalb_Chr08g0233811 [Lupinus albus]